MYLTFREWQMFWLFFQLLMTYTPVQGKRHFNI